MEKKVDVVHIAQANGGVERYLKMFFKYSDRKKINNYLIASEQYIDSINEFKNLGVEVYIVKMCRELSPFKDIKSSVEIYKILKKLKPDIVYCHSSKAGGLGRIPGKLNGCINIYNPHGWAFDMNGSSFKKKVYVFIEKILSICTDKIIAISRHEKEVAKDNGICNVSKIEIIENGIDLNNIVCHEKENLYNKLGLNKQNIIIGMVARITEQKSPRTFIEIAQKLSMHNEEYRFIIVGDGDQRKEIENLIDEKGLKEKVILTGWVNNVEEYINIFDIALLTSKWEGFGLVIPEYMACRKPIVASRVGGIMNIIEHSVDGYLVDNLDINQFVNYISLLIDNPDIKDTIIKNAWNKVSLKYDFNRVIVKHEQLFKKYE